MISQPTLGNLGIPDTTFAVTIGLLTAPLTGLRGITTCVPAEVTSPASVLYQGQKRCTLYKLEKRITLAVATLIARVEEEEEIKL